MKQRALCVLASTAMAYRIQNVERWLLERSMEVLETYAGDRQDEAHGKLIVGSECGEGRKGWGEICH
jgi:hypothetical protein